MDRKERPFSIVGDIKKPHRRFKHLAKEQGFLANTREGPAGQLDDVNCASYWWTRVAACGIRATHHLLGRCPIDMFLDADDLLPLGDGGSPLSSAATGI